MPTEEQAHAIKNRYRDQLWQPGVVAVGVERADDGDFVIAIYLENDRSKAASLLPKDIEGCRIKLIESGPFRAL